MSGYQENLPVAIPKDPNARPVSVLFGYDPATGKMLPLKMTANSDGTFTLESTASFSGTIGDVAIKDGSTSQLATVNASGELLIRQLDINMTAEYTYRASSPGLGKVDTIKTYPTGSLAGSPAQLTTYTYNVDDKVETIVDTATTV